MSIIVLSYLFSNLYDGLKLGKEPPDVVLGQVDFPPQPGEQRVTGLAVQGSLIYLVSELRPTPMFESPIAQDGTVLPARELARIIHQPEKSTG